MRRRSEGTRYLGLARPALRAPGRRCRRETSPSQAETTSCLIRDGGSGASNFAASNMRQNSPVPISDAAVERAERRVSCVGGADHDEGMADDHHAGGNKSRSSSRCAATTSCAVHPAKAIHKRPAVVALSPHEVTRPLVILVRGAPGPTLDSLADSAACHAHPSSRYLRTPSRRGRPCSGASLRRLSTAHYPASSRASARSLAT